MERGIPGRHPFLRKASTSRTQPNTPSFPLSRPRTHSSLPGLPLGVLADMGPALLPGAAAALRARQEAHMASLAAALALASGAAERARAAAAGLSAPPAQGDPAGVPVFALLSLPSLAACFGRVAAALGDELVLKEAVVAEVRGVLEERRQRRQRRRPGAHGDGGGGGVSSGGGAGATAALAGDALRSRFLVCVAAWKLQPEHRAEAVAADLAAVADEMKGF